MGRFSLSQIKSIHVQFNAADVGSRALREFLSRCSAPKALESNPACSITHRLRLDAQPPVVALEYGALSRRRRNAALRVALTPGRAVNGVKDLINCRGLTCQQIITRVGQRTEEMDTAVLLKSAGMSGLKLESLVRK